MYVVFVLVLCILIYLYTRPRKIHIDEEGYVQKGVLSREECHKFIEVAEEFDFETKSDRVDDKPEYQIDILDGGVKNEKLWEMCKKIYKTKMPKIDKKLHYVFLKRYTPEERSHIPLHYDDNHTTMSFLLSDPNDFTGGELYVFPLEETKKLHLLDQRIKMTIERRNILINNYPNLPVLNYEQGDMAKYPGGTRMHGTLPVTSGKRYVLTYFFT
jgi:hypothetical protein